MTGNAPLADAMQELGLTQAELATMANQEVERFTGQPGTISDRNVRFWLTGKTRWPHERQRRAIEAVFRRPITELGFYPSNRAGTADLLAHASTEDPVLRRHFLASAVGAAVPSNGLPSGRHAVGMSDVHRLRVTVDHLSAMDDQQGGGPTLEAAALQQAERAHSLLQNGTASSCVRSHLYAIAAEATASAAWAAIDDFRTDTAARYLDRALTLANMSGDLPVVAAVWDDMAVLSSQRKRPADSAAAAEAARRLGIARKDPWYASLAHMRFALANSAMDNRTEALRSLRLAEAAYERAGAQERPAWTGFYNEAEVCGLASLVHFRLGTYDRAEALAHRNLAGLRPEQHRNRAYYTSHLAVTQLRQGETELACSTAHRAMDFAEGVPGSARVRKVLAKVRTGILESGTRTPEAAEWLARTRP